MASVLWVSKSPFVPLGRLAEQPVCPKTATARWRSPRFLPSYSPEKSRLLWTNHERIRVEHEAEPTPFRQHTRFLQNNSREETQKNRKEIRKSIFPARALAPFPTHENIYTLPNILTFSRLLSAPAIGYLILYDYSAAALLLFAYAGATDLVDGWIARKWGLQTVIGTVVDPLADKALMTSVTVCLALKGALPGPLALLIIGRDIILGLSAIYYRYISLPQPKTLARYWDFSLPSAEVRPTGISKINTALQLGLMGWTLSTLAVNGDVGWWGPEGALGLMWYLVGATTVWSGASYIYTKDAVRILTTRKAK